MVGIDEIVSDTRKLLGLLWLGWDEMQNERRRSIRDLHIKLERHVGDELYRQYPTLSILSSRIHRLDMIAGKGSWERKNIVWGGSYRRRIERLLERIEQQATLN